MSDISAVNTSKNFPYLAGEEPQAQTPAQPI